MGTNDVTTSAAAGSSGYGQTVQGIGSVIAPATLLTGIAFYFGWARTVAFDGYFGLDPGVVGYSTRDYVLTSLDPLFLPVLTVLVIAIAVVLVHGLVQRAHAKGTRPRELEWLRDLAAILGGVLFVFGALAVFGALPFSTPYLVGSLFPAIGVLLLAYAVGLRRRLRGEAPLSTSARVLVGLLLALSLFWAAGLYAGTVGRNQARDLAAHLDRLPGVTLYSNADLPIAPRNGVVEQSAAAGAYRFGYTGLRLFTNVGQTLFLIPQKWQHSGGAPLLVVPETDSLRVALTPGVDSGGGGSALAGGGLFGKAFGSRVAAAAAWRWSFGPLDVTVAEIERNATVYLDNTTRSTVAGAVVSGSLRRPARPVVTAPHAACRLLTRSFVCRVDPIRPHGSVALTLTYAGAKTADGVVRVRLGPRHRRQQIELEQS